jgi:GT2 family glycosyltransferase
MATKVIRFELADGPRDVSGLDGYSHALVLFCWNGTPLGRVRIEVRDDRVDASDLWWAASAAIGKSLAPAVVDQLLASSPLEGPDPQATVVITTHDRAEDLLRCLDAVVKHTPPQVEIIVVDNAPSDDSTAEVVKNYPVRYLVERRKGASWGRRFGALVARNEIVAYIDDDVVVGSGWLDGLLEPFANPEVAAVTGLVMPFELETEAQEQFELYNGFTFRGFSKQEFTAKSISPVAAGISGASACMAVRRALLIELDLFAVEMGPGTVTRSGEDTYALYRLLSLGYRIVYNPKAVVWHCHRRTLQDLRNWLHGYSVGAFVFYLRCLLLHREFVALHSGLGWFLDHHLRQLWRGLRGRPNAQPLGLTLAEIRGVLEAPMAYFLSRRRERALGLPPNVEDQPSGVRV